MVQLQEVLISANLMHPHEVRRGKGFYGPFTTKAIAAIQRDSLNVEPTGVFDAAVRAYLLQKLGVAIDQSVELPAAPLSRGTHGAVVAQLQDALIAAGHMNPSHPYIRFGKGMFGPYTTQTIAGIQQKELHVEATGEYDERVRSYLLNKLGGKPTQDERDAAAAKAAATKSVPAAPESAADSQAPGQADKDAKAAVVNVVNKVNEKEMEQDRSDKFSPPAPSPPVPTDPTTARHLLLLEMGFDDAEVATALEATQGSLDNAAEWLFVAREEAKAVFPEEWEGLVGDLMEMGFEEVSSKEALKRADGSLKDAIKALVLKERTQ